MMGLMIPYEELDRALARWKARSQNASGDAARQFEESGPVPTMDARPELDGYPSARFVVLKEVSDGGFVFCTQAGAALTFW